MDGSGLLGQSPTLTSPVTLLTFPVSICSSVKWDSKKASPLSTAQGRAEDGETEWSAVKMQVNR